MNFFETGSTSSLPTVFPNFDAVFLQTFFESPFEYCLAALAMLELTSAEVYGGRKIFAGVFLSKKFEEEEFFRGQVLLFHKYQS